MKHLNKAQNVYAGDFLECVMNLQDMSHDLDEILEHQDRKS